jgi:hypothetical protein
VPRSDELPKFMLRLPDGLRGRIKALAAANRRSMNAEIVVALEEHLGAATGDEFGDHAPAAAVQNPARQGGNSINPVIEEPK